MTNTLITEEARILGLTEEQALQELDACVAFGQNAARLNFGNETDLTVDERNQIGW